MKRLTTEQFVKKSRSIHKNRYDYKLSDYNGSKSKVIIICKIHGEFSQNPRAHYNGQGCPKCKAENQGNRTRLTNQQFISKAKLVHGDKYDYSLVEYINSSTNVKIICKNHGVFEQTPNNHAGVNPATCPKCASTLLGQKQTLSNDEFIKRAKKVHGNKYDYSLTNYKNSHTKVTVVCHKHGEFYPKPYNHTSNKSGCPICKESKGEKRIAKWLDNNLIKHSREKTFSGCKKKQRLPFDFYLAKQNICIEYDGQQNFTGWNNRPDSLKRIQENDSIKTNYCKQNNIKLIRIPYLDFDSIEDILSSHLH